MDKVAFVQKVKMLCLQMGVKPTIACKECGVGGSFLSDINRGQTPSVERVQMLASYLGVTTSELLGEEKTLPTPYPGLTAKEAAVIDKYRSKPELQPAVDILLGLSE